MVGVSGFEPPAPASRRQCSTRLSYTPADENTDYRLITDLASLIAGTISGTTLERQRLSSSAAITASPIPEVLEGSAPLTFMRSAVRIPSARTLSIAASSRSASALRSKE